MRTRFIVSSSRRAGFSLIEVVLAIGIFLVTVLALVGLLGPTLQSVDEVEKTDEVSSIVNTLNAFLQSSPDIALVSSKFDSIYNAVADGGEATVYIYRWYEDSVDDQGSPIIKLEVGFASGESGSGWRKFDCKCASVKPCRFFKGSRHHLSCSVDAVICVEFDISFCKS